MIFYLLLFAYILRLMWVLFIPLSLSSNIVKSLTIKDLLLINIDFAYIILLFCIVKVITINYSYFRKGIR